MSDGFSHFVLESSALSTGQHYTAVLVDGGAQICRFVLDGASARPTEEQPVPFSFFDRNFGEVVAGQPLRKRADVKNPRLYREWVTASRMAMIQRWLKKTGKIFE